MLHVLSSALILLTVTARSTQATNTTDNCWNQWEEYYTAQESEGVNYSNINVTVTTVVAYTNISFSQLATPRPVVVTRTATTYANQAGFQFPVGTETYLQTPGSESAVALTTEYTRTETITEVRQTTLPLTITTPACYVPPVVPQCQTSWDNYVISNGSAAFPMCQQAKINSATCESLISIRYQRNAQFGDSSLNAWVTSNLAGGGSTTWWPTTMSYAPSCTLGCRQCVITADTVQLFYWPPSSATAVENGTQTAFISGHPTRNSSEPMTVFVDGTTLSSPTVYISYATLYASDSCSGVGNTHSHTIIPLASSAQLSSLAWHNLGSYARGPAQWGIPGGSWECITKPFNYDDMNEPIPQSVWNQLPSCALSSYQFQNQNVPGTFICSTGGPYNPIIALPTQVKNVDPAWASCRPWYGGAYDPPIALQPVAAIAQPTAPASPTQPPAMPVSNQVPDMPQETSKTINPSTTNKPILGNQPPGTNVAPSSDPTSTERNKPTSENAPTAYTPTTTNPPAAGEPAETSHTSVIKNPPSNNSQPAELSSSSKYAQPAASNTKSDLSASYQSVSLITTARYTYLPETDSAIASLILKPFQTDLTPGSAVTLTYSRASSGDATLVNGQTTTLTGYASVPTPCVDGTGTSTAEPTITMPAIVVPINGTPGTNSNNILVDTTTLTEGETHTITVTASVTTNRTAPNQTTGFSGASQLELPRVIMVGFCLLLVFILYP